MRATTPKIAYSAATNNLGLVATTPGSLHAKPRATNNLGLAELTTNTTHANEYLGLVAPINASLANTTNNLGLAAPTTNTLAAEPSTSKPSQLLIS